MKYKPDHYTYMTKEARGIANSIYVMVDMYQPDIVFDVLVLESAARNCRVGKYRAMAQQWIRPPSRKSIDQWKENLKSFANYFEKVDKQNAKGLSELYRDRSDEPIVWTPKLINIYEICATKLIQDWSSYDEMDILISWSKDNKITEVQIQRAFNLAISRAIINIKYIDGIIRREKATNEFIHKKESAQVDNHAATPVFRGKRTIEDALREAQIREMAREEYLAMKDAMEFDRQFEEDENGN